MLRCYYERIINDLKGKCTLVEPLGALNSGIKNERNGTFWVPYIDSFRLDA